MLKLFDFFNEVNVDTVILTPNRRLSATLHQHYQQYQLQQQTTWLTPKILPVTTWIHHLWKDYTNKNFSPSPYLLNTSQEQYVWEKIILSTKEYEQLLQVSETADLARSAWILLMQWQVDIQHPLFASSEDYAAFSRWAKAFQNRCENNHWIDMAVLPTTLMEKMASHEIIPPRSIMTYGFTEYAPQLKQLFSSCENTGSRICKLDSEDGVTTASKRINLEDDELEVQTMARWAKSIYEREPSASIGCVIPSLDKIRDRVMQVFSEVFAADDTYTIDLQKAAFNISAGKSLSQYPVINTALQILSLHKKNISLEAISHLLASPFIGEAEIERIKRANYDNQLRFHNKSIITLESIKAESIDSKLSLKKSCPHLAKRLHKFIASMDENQQAQELSPHSVWAQHFNEMLSCLGWPGERSLNSDEYQMIESWLNLLVEFASLDQVAKPVNFNQALHTLKKMAANKIFQPKSPDAPIQVLGLLEAAGLPFDYLWVAALDDISWPPPPAPNPFIPKRLQRDLRMPHATAERELSFCNSITRQFKQSAGEVIFSHADKRDDLELQASPLIRNLPRMKLEDLQLKEYINPNKRIFHSRDIESLVDDKAPVVAADEKIRGGVSVIKYQALCPFRSFSEWRLHAHAVESPLPGMLPKDRGTVMHKSLELIWNQLQDQTTLLTLDESQLEVIIQDAITAALPPAYMEYKQYLTLEKKRLSSLIHEWLQLEKLRPPFTLMTNEKTVQFTLGPLTLSMRIDRIDQLQDGTKFILDYKTGKNNEINSWFSDRPEEPQLPLYALLDPDNTSGITFAQIHAGEYCFKGISHEDLEIKGVKLISEMRKTPTLSWKQQLQEWRDILTKLSTDFYEGFANVDPKDSMQTCKWCALKPLCRIHEEIMQ